MNKPEQQGSESSKLTLLNRIRYYWRLSKDYYQLIKLARFSVFIALVVILFVLVPQGKEALIVMQENAEDSNYLQLINFIVFNFILALMCWYYARVLYFFVFEEKLNQYCHFKRHFPRLLGVSMIFIPALVVIFTKSINNSLFWYLLGSSLLFLFFVYFRRDIFKLKKIEEVKLENNEIRELPSHTKTLLISFLILNFLLLFVFTFFGAALSIAIGTTAVVMLALATLVSVGSTVTFFSETKGIPFVFILLLIAVLTSLISDNHEIRTDIAQPPILTKKTTLKDHFSKWLSQRTNADGKPIPVFFISTEGGGIRAAYWTALVLGHLQDKNPKFAEHVYAISGVSGGSLGASVFAALLSQDNWMDKNEATDNCDDNADKNYNYFCRSKRILREDFLAPTVASMMFADAFQRFCFVCSFDDRAQALEQSWEDAWDKEWNEQGQGVFSSPFESLWASDRKMKIPQLLLNSTVVETGQRIIATSLNLEKENFTHVFHDALATFDVTNKSMRLSTAAHTSARFTYVSPAGTLLRTDITGQKQWIRLVDGGYFENSGSTAIIETLNEITSEKQTRDYLPVVIHISNDPVDRPDDNGFDKKAKGNSQYNFLGELLSPIEAIFSVRGGKGKQARIALEFLTNKLSGSDNYLHFKLSQPKNKVQLPLGWMLSSKAQTNMDNQLLKQSDLIEKVMNKLDYLTRIR